MLVGTVDGVALLARGERGWTVKHRALQGVFVSARDGARRRHPVRRHARRRHRPQRRRRRQVDLGQRGPRRTMSSGRRAPAGCRAATWCSSARCRRISMSARTRATSWRELPAFRKAKTVKQWTFPPPPRIGHIKDIVLDGDRLLVGVEIGSLQVSNDFGESFTELPVDPDPQECDIHRILVHPARPRPHHHRQRHRRHDGERGRRRDLAAK